MFALLVRAELFFPGAQLWTEDQYNQLFTLHGAVMVFLVIIPGLPAALGNFVLPLQLGAPDVAFPRLNLFSFYLWCTGAALLLLSLIVSAADTGWTFYTPYSTTTGTAVVPAVGGAFVLGFSSIFTGLNFITTIHKFKPAGMTWFRMPLNLWGIYSTALLQVLATPVLGITLLLLLVERTMHIGIFDPALGGDPVLFQHFFWFYSHPAVYIMILPAMAVMSDLITTHAHKHIFGYRFIAYSSIGLAALSFLVWGHHMFVSGQSKLAGMVFSALTFTVAIPSAIKVFNWVATLYKARHPAHLADALRPVVHPALHHRRADRHLPGRAQHRRPPARHLLRGGALPLRDDGLRADRVPGRAALLVAEDVPAACTTSGSGSSARSACSSFFNLTFLPQFVMGSRGMARRYFDYDPEFTIYHQVSSIGAFLMGITLVVSFVNLVVSLFRGRPAPRNPWGGTTLEWQAPSPPPLYNFYEHEQPVLYDIYDYDDLVL